ncbi:MAG: hypothetical protein ACYCYM_05575 [Saccharofermentanales bacterium]
MCDAILSLVGVLIGALVGFAATYYATKSSQKSIEKIEIERLKHDIDMDNRKREIDIFIDIAKIIGELIIIETSPAKPKEINVEAFKNKAQKYADYCINKTGEMRLFLPQVLFDKIIHYNAEICILAQNENLIPKNISDIENSSFRKTINGGYEIIFKLKSEMGIDLGDKKKV